LIGRLETVLRCDETSQIFFFPSTNTFRHAPLTWTPGRAPAKLNATIRKRSLLIARCIDAGRERERGGVRERISDENFELSLRASIASFRKKETEKKL
jgi:hypothetical protein